MKKLTALLFILSLTILAGATTKRALLVIIGDYPAQSGWNSLAGHNDKAILMEMLARNGFSENNIVCLEDEDGTYDRIISSLENLKKATTSGDVVYIHFSCHGQQITDLDGDEALQIPGKHFEESLVPYDAAIAYGWNGYRGEHHLIDDELNIWLEAIQEAAGVRGRVLLVADACHSGGIQRMETAGGVPYRGTFDKFKIPFAGSATEPVSVPETWITISACKDFQTNFEVELDGIRYGRLTYAICQTLTPHTTPASLLSAVQQVFNQLPMPAHRHQTAVLACPSRLKHKAILR